MHRINSHNETEPTLARISEGNETFFGLPLGPLPKTKELTLQVDMQAFFWGRFFSRKNPCKRHSGVCQKMTARYLGAVASTQPFQPARQRPGWTAPTVPRQPLPETGQKSVGSGLQGEEGPNIEEDSPLDLLRAHGAAIRPAERENFMEMLVSWGL